MAHLIDKDALVAEIEKSISNGQVKLQESQECGDYESNVAWSEYIATCRKILSFIDTMKEEPDGYHKYLCIESVDIFEKGKTYKAHKNSPIAKMKNNFVLVEEDLRKQLKFDVYKGLLSFIDSLQEEPKTDWLQELQERLSSLSKEDFKKVMDKYSRYGEEDPVSEDLEDAAEDYCKSTLIGSHYIKKNAFKAGAKWQKEHLLKPADGNDLPEIDREVIAILDYDFGHYKVVYAHRPNPNGWNGTNLDTGEKEHFEPEIYGKGGWNQPHVLYWLDARLPYEENKFIKEL